MSRVGWLLIALLSLLLIIGWYFLVFDPTRTDIDDVRAQTELIETQAAEQRQRAQELREVRQAAPEAEAALSAGQQIIPGEASIPALFRQLQQASDDAGVRLLTINPAEPALETIGEDEATTVASIGIAMSLEGSYFQIVDLARRLEDPSLTPRALRWDAASLTVGEFPELSVSLSGQVFSRGETELPEQDEAADEVPESETEDGQEDAQDGQQGADEPGVDQEPDDAVVEEDSETP